MLTQVSEACVERAAIGIVAVRVPEALHAGALETEREDFVAVVVRLATPIDRHVRAHAGLRVAGVLGARVPVVAGQGSAEADPASADVFGRALEPVVARRNVVRERTARCRVAAVVGTLVPIVAGQDCAGTRPIAAAVVVRTRVSVVAR